MVGRRRFGSRRFATPLGSGDRAAGRPAAHRGAGGSGCRTVAHPVGQVPGVAGRAMSDVLLAALLGGLLAGLAAGTVVAIPPVVVNKDVAGTYLLLIVINT